MPVVQSRSHERRIATCSGQRIEIFFRAYSAPGDDFYLWREAAQLPAKRFGADALAHADSRQVKQDKSAHAQSKRDLDNRQRGVILPGRCRRKGPAVLHIQAEDESLLANLSRHCRKRGRFSKRFQPDDNARERLCADPGSSKRSCGCDISYPRVDE